MRATSVRNLRYRWEIEHKSGDSRAISLKCGPADVPKLSRPGEVRASVGRPLPGLATFEAHSSLPSPCIRLVSPVPPHSRLTDAVDSRSPTLSRSSESHAGLPKRLRRPATRTAVPVQNAGPAQDRADAPELDRFNTAPSAEAEAALLNCCGSRRWAVRVAAHRPYPDLDALLAAADEAGYDLPPPDLAEALAAEVSPDCTTPRRTPPIWRSGPRTRRTSAASVMSS